MLKTVLKENDFISVRFLCVFIFIYIFRTESPLLPSLLTLLTDPITQFSLKKKIINIIELEREKNSFDKSFPL